LELITSEQRDELISTLVKRDAFHLELKDVYAAAIEDGPFATWANGEPDDYAWFQAWLSRIRHATQSGRTVRRVRVITEPVTDYIRWEYSTTALNLEVGEDIRWLPRHLLPEGIVLPVSGNDWWLLDDRIVAVGHVCADGRVKGHEIITDTAVVADCVQLRDQLWTMAVRHSMYNPV